MDTCRIALIGAGNVARRHARVLSEFPDVALAGVTDVLPAAAAALAADAGCRVYPDAETLLADGVDAAYVCVPPFAHGAPEEAARMLLGMFEAARAGDFAAVDPTLERLLGRPPQTMRDALATAT